jgi:sorbitol-specific phosphotransferase system component IIA
MPAKPTHEQAQLHLQVFEQRREARLRQARDWFFKNYIVDSFEDAMKIAAPGTENGTNAMMVMSYWEQTCALLNYGLLHEDLFFETTGEFFGVWELIKPTIAQGREVWKNKHFLGHLEKAAQRFEAWQEARNPGHIATMRGFMQQMRQKRATAA